MVGRLRCPDQGVVALLIEGLSGLTPAEVQQIDPALSPPGCRPADAVARQWIPEHPPNHAGPGAGPGLSRSINS